MKGDGNRAASQRFEVRSSINNQKEQLTVNIHVIELCVASDVLATQEDELTS